MDKIDAYISLADLFKSHGFNLYLVGGTVRDYMFNKELTDMDAVTDATPDEVIAFLPNVDKTFARYGSLKYKDENDIKFDITTLRKEKAYLDSRHPTEVTFVKNIEEDYVRRDFTINAFYMDSDLTIFDCGNGIEDFDKNLLRMIGDPEIRLKEDPLRILRAIRFSITFDLDIEPSLYQAMINNYHLIDQLTPAKVESEIKKMDLTIANQKRKTMLFKQFDIAKLQGVVK